MATPTLITVRASAKAAKAWRGRIDHALQRRKPYEAWWDANLRRYAPRGHDNVTQYNESINTNRDYTLVERKKSDLFFRRPDVSVLPTPLMAGQEAVLQVHQTILNEKLGEDGVDAGQLMDEVLFDALCPAGFMWSVLGYSGVFQDTPIPDMVGADGNPVLAPVPIHEEVFWSRLSPKQILLPEEFKSCHYDKAPWLGFQFEMPLRQAKRLWSLPAAFEGDAGSESLRFDHGEQTHVNETMVRGTEIWYQSSLYRDEIAHPLHQTKLVLIDGVDAPVEHRDSPHQAFDEMGRLSPDSLVGYPIHGGTLRTMSDAAYVPSDCTISAPLVSELNKFRDQMVRTREANIPIRIFDEEVLPPEVLRKILAAPIGGMIPVPKTAFMGEGPFKEIARANFPRENFTSNDYVDNDIARTHAIDATQSGAQDAGTVKTATEIQMQQGNANARLDKERNRVLSFYLRGVTKFSTLLQRYLRVEQAAEIVGPEAAQQWAMWAKAIPTRVAFTLEPDSSLRTDTAQRRSESMQMYQFLANDPNVNRPELTKQVIKDFRKDPAKMVTDQPPPPPTPKPNVSFSIKGEDISPLSPQYDNVRTILAEYGIQLPEASPDGTPEPPPAAGPPPSPPPHPGGATPVPPLSKHAADRTGGMQGSGAPAPLGPGGQVG